MPYTTAGSLLNRALPPKPVLKREFYGIRRLYALSSKRILDQVRLAVLSLRAVEYRLQRSSC